MALYALALVLLLGIAFLLYCLWNFSRDLKPRKTSVFAPSGWPAWGSVHPMPTPRLRRQNALFTSKANAVDHPDRDYRIPARFS
jgi:hypothetical protein